MSLQEQFDRTYISSTEICRRLELNRSSVFHGARTGKLPAEAIVIRRTNGDPHITLWLRELAEPMLAEWSKAIAVKKGQC